MSRALARPGTRAVARRRINRLAVAATALAPVWAWPIAAAAQGPCDALVASARSASLDALLELADCFERAGDAARAVDTLESALSLVPAPPSADSSSRIDILGRLGRSYALLGDYRTALARLSDGISVAEARGRPAAAAPLLNDLGGIYMQLQQPLEGLAAFADSRRLAGSAGELGATAGLNLARVLLETDADPALAARLDRLSGETQALRASPAKAALLLGLAALHGELPASGSAAGAGGRTDVRDALLDEALALAMRFADPALIASAHLERARRDTQRGATERALSHTRSALLIAQANGLTDLLYRAEWQVGRLLRERGARDDALRAYRAAIRTLGGLQAAIIGSRRSFNRDVLPLYEEYADLMLLSASGLSGDAAADALAEVQQTLEQLHLAEVRNYFENQCAVPEAFEPRREQPDGALVIYPMLFAQRMELLVSTGSSLHQITVEVGLEELTQRVRRLRETIESAGSGDAYLEHARQLYEWLIAPLEPVLEQAGPTTLVFVPDGPLRTIPLAVLHDGRDFVVERYALATTPGLSLIGAVSSKPVSRVLVNGITAPVQGFAALPFVEQELENIAATFPSRTYADESFVTATLQREILDGGYSIVHLATHARFESDYRRSFLLAYDDLITMDQLEDIMGSQRHTDAPIDLLVLSACQTAAGDERAALGLAGVAVKAGARSALASLWFINDESTARLVAEFYRQLAAAGNSKADALRGAQLLLMNDTQYRHPAYWAPFLMIGDWR
jgi:CHAT domain-containing protein